MSVEKVRAGEWRVRWRDESNRERSKVIGPKRDAQAYDAEIKRRKRLGEAASMDDGKLTVDELAEKWWREHARGLAESTRRTYAHVYDKHLKDRIGSSAIRSVTTARVVSLKADLQDEGVGLAAIAKALVVGQSIFAHAVRCGYREQNPFTAVAKPNGKRARAVVCLPPAKVEAIRRALLGEGRLRDAVIVSVLAYAGLRPQEAQALSWRHVRDRTLLIEQATALSGDLKTTKTERTRTVRLLGPLATDLNEWRMACGRPSDDTLVFPAHDGKARGKTDWDNWRKRIFQPAARAAATNIESPYHLRHSFVSLLLHEGVNPVEVARQAGHSLQTMWSTYAHVIEELEGAERVSAEAEIRAARNSDVSGMCRPDASAATG